MRIHGFLLASNLLLALPASAGDIVNPVALRYSSYPFLCHKDSGGLHCTATNPVSSEMLIDVKSGPTSQAFDISIPTPASCPAPRRATYVLETQLAADLTLGLKGSLKYGTLNMVSAVDLTPSEKICWRCEVEPGAPVSTVAWKVMDQELRGFRDGVCDDTPVPVDDTGSFWVPQFSLKGRFYETL
jgi:hypothetical protein